MKTILEKLSGVKKNGKNYTAICPSHNDKKPSLSITEKDNKILLHCHAGCSIGDICAAIGVKPKDLFSDQPANNKSRIIATYDYKDETGVLLFQTVRFEPKGFRQRKPDGKNWAWNLNGTPRVLYHLPELLRADKAFPVFIVEGEKDVENLRKLNLTATCNPQGAGKWREEYSSLLEGFDCVILPDNDDAGRKHAEDVAKNLLGKAERVRILHLPGLKEKGDVSDWLIKGNNGEDLFALLDGADIITEESFSEDLEPEETDSKKLLPPPAKVSHDLVLQEILDYLEPINFHTKANLKPDDRLPQKHLIVLCIDELLETVKRRNFDLARKNDFIFVFNGEFWREIDRDTLKNFLGKVARKLSVNELEAKHYDFQEKLYRQFLASAYFESLEQKSDTVLINLKNGTFEITEKTQRLREFRARDFLTYQLPFEYNPQAAYPLFQKYLERVLPEKELQNILAEFFGYVFTKRLKMEKALFLYGSGANGKSVLFDVINALLGRENISNFSLSDLLQEHNRALIANNLLNYGSEINASLTRDIFKILVSTEPIQARLKYGNSFQMEDYAKLAFNCNELPKDFDRLHAYFRRLLIIPFRVTIPESKQIKTLAETIIKDELAGVFNWILEGLRRLLKNSKFTESSIVTETIENYRLESDSVLMFVDEMHYIPTSALVEENRISVKILFRNYVDFCIENRFEPTQKVNFTNRLKAQGFVIKKGSDGLRAYLETRKSDKSDESDVL